jgi:hypothetical protein
MERLTFDDDFFRVEIMRSRCAFHRRNKRDIPPSLFVHIGTYYNYTSYYVYVHTR